MIIALTIPGYTNSYCSSQLTVGSGRSVAAAVPGVAPSRRSRQDRLDSDVAHSCFVLLQDLLI